MSRICKITGKHSIIGKNRSRAMNATKRYFFPNLHYHRFWLADKKRFIKLQVSAKGMRIIDKKGIEVILNNLKY